MERAPDRARVEYGDFQTPPDLAKQVCELLYSQGMRPRSVLEPTCGSGSFVRAAVDCFAELSVLRAFDASLEHITRARTIVQTTSQIDIELQVADFFLLDWDRTINALPEPLLVLGNPPWVTNATLGSFCGRNAPSKSNLDDLRGIDALTGKSNFDISEWMLRRSLQWLKGRQGALAVLCKTSVARRVLAHAWREKYPIDSASVHRFDARAAFGVAVDACLFVVRVGTATPTATCREFDSFAAAIPLTTFGFRDGHLVSNIGDYDRLRDLHCLRRGLWRSGIKHDCSQVFELEIQEHGFCNLNGDVADIEPEVVFPLMKATDVALGRHPRRWLLITQQQVAQDPNSFLRLAPKSLAYVMRHAALLDGRRSSIYKGRPRFSMFGIGHYSFTPWKVAISGLHKRLGFVCLGPYQGKPVVLDDTCYFLPCDSERQAETVTALLESSEAREFLSSLVFWDSKRPITATVLNSLDLVQLAKVLGWDKSSARFECVRRFAQCDPDQSLLFREAWTPYVNSSHG